MMITLRALEQLGDKSWNLIVKWSNHSMFWIILGWTSWKRRTVAQKRAALYSRSEGWDCGCCWVLRFVGFLNMTCDLICILHTSLKQSLTHDRSKVRYIFIRNKDKRCWSIYVVLMWCRNDENIMCFGAFRRQIMKSYSEMIKS